MSILVSTTWWTPKRVFATLGFVIPVAHVTIAFAQGTGGAAPGGGAGVTSGTPGPGGAPVTVTQVAPATTTQFFPGGVAPLPPGGVLGGGNAQFSSSKAITGNETDTFDYKTGGGGAASIHGDQNSSFVLGGHTDRGSFSGVIPDTHNVRKGDTLWGICGFYFQNPYQWPRIWSYNAQIQNPHWIYPGDLVKLKNATDGSTPPPPASQRLTDRRRQVPPETIFLRNEGYIEDESSNWGEINGSREDKMFLTDYDEAYIRVSSDHEVKVGQELTVYRPLRNVSGGKLIEIQGTVKVDQWNAKDRIARARITEALDTIERGARVGPISRRFEVVAPVRNDKDVEASVLTSVHAHEFWGANQAVFIDKGEDDGLKPGNRLFIISKGDGFHMTQPTGSAAKRIAIENESPGAMEDITKPRDPNALPEEVVAELRVITVRKKTAMTLVTLSRREIEQGDRAVARKGY